jgi:prephenate dehydratase
MRVAYLGPPGTYSHEALIGLPGADAWTLDPTPTIHAAVSAVQGGAVDRALVPIENSLEGSVNATLDALALDAHDVEIVGELLHPIHHCLVTASDELALAEVSVVASHPQASAQCADFLRHELPHAMVSPAASTAEAVRTVVDRADGGWAAIGSRAAATLYGGRVLRADVEDVQGNETRFAWLAPAGTEPVEMPDEGDPRFKTAIVWWGAGSGSPGWLVRCLSEFAFRGVNLTRIESRPRREAGLGEYRFFADLEGRAHDAALRGAIDGLRVHATTVRVLGSFPAAG